MWHTFYFLNANQEADISASCPTVCPKEESVQCRVLVIYCPPVNPNQLPIAQATPLIFNPIPLTSDVAMPIQKLAAILGNLASPPQTLVPQDGQNGGFSSLIWLARSLDRLSTGNDWTTSPADTSFLDNPIRSDHLQHHHSSQGC